MLSLAVAAATALALRRVPGSGSHRNALLMTLAAAPPPAPRAAYIHLPFCRRRCFYCDFPIAVVGSKPNAADSAAARYCSLLLREMRASPARPTLAPPLRSVYFGGGTPSLTPPHNLAELIRALDDSYGLAEGCEVTLEMDPGTFDADRLDAYLDAGASTEQLNAWKKRRQDEEFERFATEFAAKRAKRTQ